MKEFEHFGDFILHHRRKAGLTQRELGAAAGVSKTTVWNIESNRTQSGKGLPPRPTLETIEALCAALNADAATAKLLVYPPDEAGSVILAHGEHSRLPESPDGVNIRRTIDNLMKEAQAYHQAACRLEDTANSLRELL